MPTTDIEMLRRHAELTDSDVLDVGCGHGRLTRELAALGARVTGVEISEQQLAAARAADDGSAGTRYLVGRAEALPLPDASFDLVVFRASLHHVAPEQMQVALSEAARVLRPDGLLYVTEPLAKGDFYALVSIVDDEDEVRDAAQRALAAAASVGLHHVATEEYELVSLAGDVDALRRRMVAVDPERAVIFDAHRHVLEHRFAELGEPVDDGGRQFTETMRAVVLSRAPAGDAHRSRS
jgi:ubiquinone/menaquinone biosynthesis C-methylase UbiE